MDIDDWLWFGIACLAALVALNAFATAAETAVALARRARIAQAADDAARAAEQIVDDADRVFRAARAWATITRTLAPLLGLFAGALALRVPLQAGAPPGAPPSLFDLPTYGAAVVAAMVIVPLVSELLPRSIISRRPEAFLLAAAPVVSLFLRLMSPLEWVTRTAGAWLAPGAPPTGAARAAHSEEEIKILVEGSAEEGVLEEEERDMIHSIFEFTDTVVRKVMVPRTDMTCFQANTPIEEALTVVMEEGHSRLPLYEETVDQIVGIVHIKDLLLPLAEGRRDAPLRIFMRQPYFVPEGKKVDELLREFKRERLQMAIVVDEYGGTSGLVTIEDLLEEIVGDIRDEYDVEEPALIPVDEHTTIVDARMNIDDANEQLDLHLPTEEFDTVGGFVFGLLGHVPNEGDTVTYDDRQFVVEKVEGNRIEKVRVVRPGAPPSPPSASAEGAPASPAPAPNER